MGTKNNICNDMQTDLSFLFSGFFDVFTSMTADSLFAGNTVSAPVYKDYLQKGEFLVSLAKEKFRKQLGKIALSAAEEKIFQTLPAETDTLRDIAGKIARCFTRPMIKAMETYNDEYAQTLLAEINGLSIHATFEDIKTEEDEKYVRYAQYHFHKEKKDNLTYIKMIIMEESYEPIIIYGAKEYSHPAAIKNLPHSSNICIADLALTCAFLIIYKQIFSTLAAIQKASESINDTLMATFMKRVFEYEKIFIKTYIKVWPKECTPLLEHLTLREVFSHPIHVSGKYKGQVHPFVTNMLDDIANGIAYTDHKDRRECESFLQTLSDMENPHFQIGYGQNQLFYCYLLKKHIPYHMLLDSLSYGSGVLWYPMPSSKPYHKYRHYESMGMLLLADLYRLIAKEKNIQRQMVSYYRDLERTYAKSYMLKKTISQKTKAAMEASLFNKYFGFVEFDADTDLGKVEEIAREFQALKETYMPLVDSSANAIRFRRLGQHKALGLYYPTIACLCVDIHSPSSLVHEYGHLIDYCYGNLSSQYAFSKIRDLYINNLDYQMGQNKALKKRMSGSGKYNRSYFTMATEIFARCFEIYISKCLGVKNSIVPASFTDEGIYPTNPHMLSVIHDYFSSLELLQYTNNRFSIRLHMNEGGITGIWDAICDRFYMEDGLVLRFAKQDTAIMYLESLQRSHGMKITAPIFTTPTGVAYKIADSITTLETGHEEVTMIIDRVDEDYVWNTIPNSPEQDAVSIDRTAFERYLDTGYFSIVEKDNSNKESVL